MPRIIVLRLFRWGPWVGFHLNDRGEPGKPRFGYSEAHAAGRACWHLP